MRVVVQRVLEARVTVQNQPIAAIGRGLLLFVGFAVQDETAILERMAEKIVNLRVFADEEGKMNRSVVDIEGAVLSVSQFTLYGDVKRGRRPSFTAAAPPEHARHLYQAWNTLLSRSGLVVQTGSFGADMKIALVNDGPVTLWLDSDELFR
ncbi:MAG: D-aminoacyl-tRNA deacylase [Candidatus Carbobacillus sp.]|nr:D-aminoacyl-tRNA deacylase [Candidatus Carbobacillus sp.]